MTLRLLSVHAHPDDESSKGAATLAKYAQQGVDVLVVSCTGGERGDVLNPAVDAMPVSSRDLAGLRRGEMARAQHILGIQHTWLGYEDSGLPDEGDPVPPMSFADIPAEESAEALVRIVRRFQPHVMITYNEQGGYPHPDHIRCHEISMIAFEQAGIADSYPEAGEPWQPQKLYYDEMFSVTRAQTIRDAVLEDDPNSPMLEMLDAMLERNKDRGHGVTTRIDVPDTMDERDDALRAHASQVAPDHPFFFGFGEVARKVWPYEEFRLARSHVTTSTNFARGDFETDLFDGIEKSGVSR